MVSGAVLPAPTIAQAPPHKSRLAALVCATFFLLMFLLAATGPAEAAPVAFRSSSSLGRASAAAGAFTVSKPPGTVAGDVMVASIGYRPCSSSSGGGCTTSIAAPAGWTLIRLVEQRSGGGTGGYGLRLGIWYRVVTAADAAVANYTWTIGGAPTHNGAAGVIASFQNVDTANPVVVDAGQTTASSRNHATPDLGVLATNTMLVSTHAALSSATWTPPVGMTEILDWASQTVPNDLGMSIEINYESRPAPGLTGTRTATFSNPPTADAGATHILALRPYQADPKIAMTLNNNLIVGSTSSYTLNIGNNGPLPIAAANIAVTNTLPTGLTFASGTGTGWSCTAVVQVVTCTYSGAELASGGALPALTINVDVVSGSVWTNTATVSSGADGDNNLTDSTATYTWPANITTLATGTDPAAATIGPGALATDVNSFTLRTNTGTEPISAVTVNLSSPLGIDTLAITDNANNVLGSVAFPATSGAISIPVIGMTATTALQIFKVRITPLVHVSMPAPPGGTYTITAPVTSWTGPAGHAGADTNANALTIDNQSPNSATSASGAAGVQRTTLNWTTSASTDFVTTSGSVIYRWAAATAGGEVPIEGSSPLRGEVNGTATVACVVSSARSAALTRIDGAGGSPDCTTTALVNGQPYTYKIFQKDALGNFDTGVLVGTFGGGSPAPGSLNAFETTTVAGSVAGPIGTKVAGSAFSLDLVALNAIGSAVLGSFNDNVTVDLIANSSTGVALSSGCPVSGTIINVGTRTISAGRSTVSIPAVANSWRDVRVRIRYPTSSPTVTSCSSDNFAVKPSYLSAVASDDDWATAGTTNTLNAATVTATPIHKAGRPFTLQVTAYNASGVVTGNYAGSPTANTACLLPAIGCSGTLTTGTFSSSGGTATSTTASFSDVGAISATFVDSSYASVDSADTSADCSGYYVCSAGTTIGRFVPDRFEIATNTPAFVPGCGSFTYLGQGFGFGTAPVWTVTATNAGGNATQNYTGSLFKIAPATVTGQVWNAVTGTLQYVDGLTNPVVADLGAGQGSISFGVGGGLRFARADPLAPFAASLSLSASVADSEGITYASNPYSQSAIGFAGGNNQQRYGRLRLSNVFGAASPLAMPIEAQYWSGNSWVRNANDSCTALTGIFSAAPSGWAWPAAAPASSVTLAAGGGTLNISGPVSGTATVTASGVPDWLKSRWNNSPNFDQAPSARATFGIYSPETRRSVHVREVF